MRIGRGVWLAALCCVMGLMLSGCGETETGEVDPKTAVSVYLGTAGEGFRAYPVPIEGELTADKLIGAMSRLTGWELTLAEEVAARPGGMRVSFAPDSALASGLPAEPQEEFFVADRRLFVQKALDSIQETLRRRFLLDGAAPLELWYSVGDQPIRVEDVTIDMEQPWDQQRFFD